MSQDLPPVFIVGHPRSGTTLLASMLGAHPAIDCGPETFFFASLPADPDRLTDPETWPDRAVEHLRALRLGDRPVHELYGRTPDALRADLDAQPPSLAAMLEALVGARARAAGKRRWAEKTPLHLRHLPLIRATFPEARIVCVVRDPRAVALSLAKVPFGEPSVIGNLYAIARRDRQTAPQVKADPFTLVVRYEDLVRRPEPVLREICDAIGEPYDAAMTEGGRDRADTAAAHEWWKEKATQAPDPSRAEAWRTEMDERHQRAAAVVVGPILERHGYEGAASPRGSVAVEPDGEGLVGRQPEVALALAAAGIVVRGGRGGRAGARELVLWPAPGRDPWGLGRSPRSRVVAIARLAALLVGRRLRRRPTVRIEAPRDPLGLRGTGLADRLVELFAAPITVEEWLASHGAAASDLR